MALLTESFMILLILSPRVFKPLALVRSPGPPFHISSHSFKSLRRSFSTFFCSSFLNLFSSSFYLSEKSAGTSRTTMSSRKLSRIFSYISCCWSEYSAARSAGVFWTCSSTWALASSPFSVVSLALPFSPAAPPLVSDCYWFFLFLLRLPLGWSWAWGWPLVSS